MALAPIWREVRCECGARFSTRHGTKKWCMIDCLSKPKKYCAPKTKPQRRGRYGRAWNRLRQTVFAEETSCWLCGEVVDMARKFPDPWSATVDHVRLASEGGSGDRDNLRLAHFRCNLQRGWKKRKTG